MTTVYVRTAVANFMPKAIHDDANIFMGMVTSTDTDLESGNTIDDIKFTSIFQTSRELMWVVA